MDYVRFAVPMRCGPYRGMTADDLINYPWPTFQTVDIKIDRKVAERLTHLRYKNLSKRYDWSDEPRTVTLSPADYVSLIVSFCDEGKTRKLAQSFGCVKFMDMTIIAIDDDGLSLTFDECLIEIARTQNELP